MEDKLIDEEQILSNMILVSDYQDYFEELEDKSSNPVKEEISQERLDVMNRLLE